MNEIFYVFALQNILFTLAKRLNPLLESMPSSQDISKLVILQNKIIIENMCSHD